jgi:hypothetical protein
MTVAEMDALIKEKKGLYYAKPLLEANQEYY